MSCGGVWTLCFQAYVLIVPVMSLSGGAMLYIMAVYIFMPMRAWSPVTREAALKVKDERLQRLPVFSWVMMGLASASTLMGVYSNTGLQSGQPTEVKMVTYLVASLVVLVAMLTTIAWLHDLPAALKTLIGQLLPFAIGCRPLHLAGRSTVCPDPSKDAMHISRHRGRTKPCHASPREGVFCCFEASLRHRQTLMVLINSFAWSYGTVQAHPLYEACIWIFRAMAFCLLMFSRDSPATFQDLEESSRVGFGLLADSSRLADAIDAYLNEKPPLAMIPLYKASTLRMQDTVSNSL